MMLILTPGMTAVTDLGRFQGPPLGFSVNGALDQYSARVANILVGNHENAPLLEITASRFSFAAENDMLIAVTGSTGSIRIDAYTVPDHSPVSVETGQIVTINAGKVGLRGYLAVHGSFTVPLLLGSCASDSMIGFGLRLEKGQRLACNLSQAPLRNPSLDLPLLRLGPIAARIEEEPHIDVTDGPDIAEFGATAARLFENPYVVSPRSNHVGLRLAGHLPERVSNGEVLSRGVPVGAIEVPSTQELLVLHRGRGVTAGYPVLAVLTLPALDAMAQTRPGQRVRFRPTTLEQASLRQLDQHLHLTRLRERCWEVLAAHGVRDFDVGTAVVPSDQPDQPDQPRKPAPEPARSTSPQPAESRLP